MISAVPGAAAVTTPVLETRTNFELEDAQRTRRPGRAFSSASRAMATRVTVSATARIVRAAAIVTDATGALVSAVEARPLMRRVGTRGTSLPPPKLPSHDAVAVARSAPRRALTK